MDIVVQKFGGSSLASVERIWRVANYAAETHRSGRATVVVVSARGDSTDELLALAGEFGGGDFSDRTTRETDQLLVTGEVVSAALTAMAIERLGVPAVSLTGAQAGIEVAGKYGGGVISSIDPKRILALLEAGNVVVVSGFQGTNAAGDMVTLGRGGSDTTAVALAAALDASRCLIYTDVDGVYTADPRLVPTARAMPEVDVRLMAEMAFAGARVLHSRAVELAAMRGMELQVLSSFAPGAGTRVFEGSNDAMLESDGAVVAVTHDFDVARVLVRARRDLAADILSALGSRSIPVDLVARSGPSEDEFRMGFTARLGDIPEVLAVLGDAFPEDDGQVRVDRDVAKISLVGMGLLNRPEYAARMISTLAAEGIYTSWISTSQLRVSAVIERAHGAHAVAVLHREFDLETAAVVADSMTAA
ncbi:aspartate kinase [Longispora sp. NPDC051575]|uniref:aspartate kinase n=1 Tax=Longispora sp. NPDC051575 TaxID=3154943 RepID=UPI003443CD85